MEVQITRTSDFPFPKIICNLKEMSFRFSVRKLSAKSLHFFVTVDVSWTVFGQNKSIIGHINGSASEYSSSQQFL